VRILLFINHSRLRFCRSSLHKCLMLLVMRTGYLKEACREWLLIWHVRPVIHRVQRINMNRQAASTVAGTGQPENGWTGNTPPRRCNAATAGHERAERLHEEIRPQSSTRFMTLTRSFCLHGHERRTTGRSYGVVVRQTNPRLSRRNAPCREPRSTLASGGY